MSLITYLQLFRTSSGIHSILCLIHPRLFCTSTGMGSPWFVSSINSCFVHHLQWNSSSVSYCASGISTIGWHLTGLNLTRIKHVHDAWIKATACTNCGSIRLGNVDIPFSPKVNFLGVILDAELTMVRHIREYVSHADSTPLFLSTETNPCDS